MSYVTIDDGSRLRLVNWPKVSPERSREGRVGVLLLHGLSQQARFWGPVASRVRVHPIAAVDQRCHGFSEVAADADVSIDRCARDALAAISSLGWQQAIVVGHSWGASVALRACAAAPDLVAAAVLLDGGLWRLSGERAELRERLRPPDLGIAPEELRRLIEESSAIAWDDERRAALADTYVVDDHGLARTRIGVQRHMRVLDGLLDYDPTSDLRAASDRLWPVMCEPTASSEPPAKEPAPLDPWSAARAAAVQRATGLPGIRLQRWQGAVHDVPLQWPDLVAGLIDTVHASTVHKGRALGQDGGT